MAHIDRQIDARVAFILATLLAPVSVVFSAALGYSITILSRSESLSGGSLYEISVHGFSAARLISALMVAPVVENLVCVILSVGIRNCRVSGWWVKPIIIAGAMSGLHVFVLWEIHALAVFPGFLVICHLIDNAASRKIGYLASVLHHVLINAINLSIVHFLF